MLDQDYEAALENAYQKALDAELDCSVAVDDRAITDRPTAADTWRIEEKTFAIEISGHELFARIPSTRSSVSDPNDVDESEYDRKGDSSSISEDEGEEEEYNTDNENDENDYADEYEDNYQFSRGDFDKEIPTSIQSTPKCNFNQENDHNKLPTETISTTTDR